MFTSYEPFRGIVAKKYQKEIADKLKIALDDENKIHELVLDL